MTIKDLSLTGKMCAPAGSAWLRTFLIPLAVIAGLAGCSDDDESSSSTPTSLTIEEGRNRSYDTSIYEWNSPDPVTRYTFEIDDFHHGDVLVSIWDAAGHLIFNRLYWSFNGYWYVDGYLYDVDYTSAGIPGLWTIVLDYYEFTGEVKLTLQGTTEEVPPDETQPPTENSPLLDLTFGTDGRALYSTGKAFGRSVVIDSLSRSVVTGTYVDDNGERSLAVWRFLSTGSLDSTFGTGGLFTYTGADASGGVDLVLDASDQPIVVGWVDDGNRRMDLAVLRLTSAGALDGTFGTAGISTLDDGEDEQGSGVALDGSGRILITGATHEPADQTAQMLLVRYTTAGVLDPTFGTGGVVRWGTADRGVDLAVAALDRPIVVGSRDEGLAMWKYTDAGVADTTFGSSGVVTSIGISSEYREGRSIALAGDATIAVAGFRYFNDGSSPAEMTLWRYRANGLPLISFNNGGFLAYQFPSGSTVGAHVAFDSSDRILVAGATRTVNTPESDASATLWRYLSTGAADTTLTGSDGTGVARFDVRSGNVGTGTSSMAAAGSGAYIASGGVNDRTTNALDLVLWKIAP